MMTSAAGCLQRSAARSVIRMARPRHSRRDHPASVPVGQRPVPVERIGVFLFGHAGNASLVQAKVVPSRHSRSITTAILRAVAARFGIATGQTFAVDDIGTHALKGFDAAV